MEKREEFQRLLRAVSQEFEKGLGRHLSDEELIDYPQDRLAPADRETVQSHLVQCDTCRAAFKDVADFFEPAREGEMPISRKEIARKWKAFWGRVRSEEKTSGGPSGWTLIGFRIQMLAAYALVASLVVAVVLTATWGLWLRRDKQELARRLQIEESNRAELLKQVEQQNRHLQEEAGNIKKKYESQLAELSQPQLNVPVYDLLSRESIQRSAEESQLTVVKLPSRARKFTLILNGEGQAKFQDYAIEIVDRNGHLVWRGEGLERASTGNFVLVLDRVFLRAGRYALKLSGKRAGRTQRIAEYLFVLAR